MSTIAQLRLTKQVDQLTAGFLHGPGCAVGVAQGEEVLLARGYGLASVEHQVALSAQSVLRIASVSKQFTVAAALLLAREGRLDLQADMRALLPELPALSHVVRIEHLMRNTSGLPDFLEMFRLGGLGLDARLDRAAMLQSLLRNRHLNFVPGSRFLYCNSNFLLLGLMVERLSGQSLQDFLAARVFQPLGMNQTRMVVPADLPLPGLAAPYLADGAGGVRRAFHGFEHGGEGGLVSSVDDLLLWGAELLQARHLPGDLAQQLTDPTLLNHGAPSNYARGMERGEWAGMPCHGHGGLWPGYRTEFLQLPQARLTVVVISNHSAANPYRLAREVAQAALASAPRMAPAAKPKADAAGPLAPTGPAAETLAGTWLNTELPAVFTLAMQDGELQATQWGLSFALARQADGSYLPWRGAYEFRLHALSADAVAVDVGAQQRAAFQRLRNDAVLPADLLGSYRSDDLDVTWHLGPTPPTQGTPGALAALQILVQGPVVRGTSPWPLRALATDLFEISAPGYGLTATLLARVRRDASGAAIGLEVASGRIRALKLVRVAGAASTQAVD